MALIRAGAGMGWRIPWVGGDYSPLPGASRGGRIRAPLFIARTTGGPSMATWLIAVGAALVIAGALLQLFPTQFGWFGRPPPVTFASRANGAGFSSPSPPC